jgi:transposase
MDATAGNPRQERGLVIAKDKRIKRIAGPTWLVPSQSNAGGYVVDVDAASCTCPDHETRAVKCKHLWAVEYVRHRVTAPDGTTTVTETMRVTYTQNWSAYNAAQCEEKERVQMLLRALCDGILQPPQAKGRPRLPLSDVVYGAAMKVYGGMSGRRSTSDARDHEAKGLIDHAAHYNSLFSYLERPEMTPLLKALVEESALPMRAVETKFAVDSSGFGTCTYRRWYDHKYGREMKEQRWVKCHILTGCTTNVIASIEVTDETVGDAPVLPSLVNGAAERGFTMADLSADKAYLSHANLAAVEKVGAVPYIPFKSNSQGEGPAAWRKLWHLFNYKRDEFLTHYHARSNVEATFSAMKRKFGAAVRSKLPVAQRNEVLVKALCFNLSVLVHGIHELGIDPTFGAVPVLP